MLFKRLDMDNNNIIEINNLSVSYLSKKIFQKSIKVNAVNNLSLKIKKNTIYGLVGESGCGKTTTAKSIAKLVNISSGDIHYYNQNITKLSPHEFRKYRKNIQIIFQDPYSSLNPRIKVGKIVEEPIRIHTKYNKLEIKQKVKELFELVGLNPNHTERYPHEFSGGQRQRIVIAKALSVNPEFIICDEPLSALDVSIQSQIMNLMLDLKERFKLTYLFISHDIGLVKSLCNYVSVMYLGKIVESGTCEEIFKNPKHPYTKALLSSVPIPDPQKERKRKQIILNNEIPSPINMPNGCVFHPRCNMLTEPCKNVIPKKVNIKHNHSVNCNLFHE